MTPDLKIEDGHLPVPDAPGLGVDLVIEENAKYPSAHNVSGFPPMTDPRSSPAPRARLPTSIPA